MGHSSCCVVNCKNNGLNSECKFYTFPKAKYKIEQRNRWIAAVRRVNTRSWHPTASTLICSAHFVANKKSEEELSPSYVPSIFLGAYGIKAVNHKSLVERHDRYMKRKASKMESSITTTKEVIMGQMETNVTDAVVDNVPMNQSYIKVYTDRECQANIFSSCTQPEKMFICNRYINENGCCHAEIPTTIIENTTKIMVPNQKQFKHKQCGTPEKITVDQFVQTDIASRKCNDASNFNGFSSIKTKEQLLDLAGVSFENFEFLLKAVKNNNLDNVKITAENALLIFLTKMKTGLTFSAISVLFNVHRTTVSRIFHSCLQLLTTATSDLVFWPAKDIVQGTMPKCFYPDYVNTRVIIDCMEFRIEVPAGVDNRVYTYSHYKKGFTAKVLIGISPGGFISFKSKVAGGRKSDSQITIESGLIDLLEDGDDVVLADKGFPDIRRTIDEKGKQVVIVMPPFLEKKSEFTKDETEKTYNIAKVRIHVERIMQRLRIYQILNKIPANLFNCIDDIVHMCCVLVNLQPPIFSDNE
ncbi:uncharacterized protein [Venturia canescens]|uniref:uncharacterized protein n=1 Tax=Venturia canescens TaxID=32260 RepID=UPI001C9CBF86|nr:uncharacterized protein LOC122411873 [Venturia canescens]